jgi:hypothetical protein
MDDRRVDVFFYGLFMDRGLLEAKGVRPTEVRVAVVSGFELRIGTRAAIVAAAARRIYGTLMKLTHAELEELYSDPSLRAYRPEAVLAVPIEGGPVAALCYNLPTPPAPDERNAEYASKLRAVAHRLGLPDAYVASIE